MRPIALTLAVLIVAAGLIAFCPPAEASATTPADEQSLQLAACVTESSAVPSPLLGVADPLGAADQIAAWFPGKRSLRAGRRGLRATGRGVRLLTRFAAAACG
jgi:hypothetical protein